VARGKLQYAHERAKLKVRAAILDTRTRIAENQQRLKQLRVEAQGYRKKTGQER